MQLKFRIKDSRGQLNMMETLIAVSLLLVVSVAISTSITNQSGEENPNQSYLTKQGRIILATADDLGILRPSVYLADSTNFSGVVDEYHNELLLLIKSQLPITANFILERVNLETNEILPIIDIGTRPEASVNIYVSSYILSGFISYQYGTYEIIYSVYLRIWLIL